MTHSGPILHSNSILLLPYCLSQPNTHPSGAVCHADMLVRYPFYNTSRPQENKHKKFWGTIARSILHYEKHLCWASALKLRITQEHEEKKSVEGTRLCFVSLSSRQSWTLCLMSSLCICQDQQNRTHSKKTDVGPKLDLTPKMLLCGTLTTGMLPQDLTPISRGHLTAF